MLSGFTPPAGSLVKLVATDADAWVEKAWIVGLTGEVFEVVERDGRTDSTSIMVKVLISQIKHFNEWDDIDEDSRDGEFMYCCADNKFFHYCVKGDKSVYNQ